MFYVYLLASQPNGTLCVGMTRDLVKRVWEHKIKAIPGFTTKYGVDHLVWSNSTIRLKPPSRASGRSRNGNVPGRSS